MTSAFHIRGECAPGFNNVKEAFSQNFHDGAELGASLCVYQNGQLIVDLCGGFIDRKKEALWADDSLTCIYSSGKAVLAFLVARAVSDGLLDYDKPVSTYWPDFSQNGKGDIKLAQLLSHQAGLCGFPDEMPPEDWLDWDLICARLAAMAPLWPQAENNSNNQTGQGQSGYHPQTFGFLVGEVLRRVTHKHIDELLREYGFDLYCGLSPHQIARTTYMSKPPRAPNLGEINQYTQIAFLKPWSSPGKISRDDWMSAILPASNMHANARGLGAIVHPLANEGVDIKGNHVIKPTILDQFFVEQCRGDDLVLPFELSWGVGMMRNINHHYGPNENAVGHSGFGGSAIVCDRQHRLTIAYVMTKMSEHLVGDPRSVHVINAVYDCLEHS